MSTVILPHVPIYLTKQQQDNKLHNNNYSSREHCNSATWADIPDQAGQDGKLHNNNYSSRGHCNSATGANIPDQTTRE